MPQDPCPGAQTARSPRARAIALVVAIATAATAQPGSTQDAADAPATADAHAAVERIFEGMRAADSAMVRAVVAPDARFASVDGQQTPPGVAVQGVDGWISAIGRSDGAWDERVYDVEIRVDGNMASVWAPYTFYLDGTISHCGINSIEMLHDGEGWKVTQISDTRRGDDCPDPRG